MSDLIDRQAVIDLLKQMRKDGDMVPWEGKDVFARIRKLPTIQHEKAQLPQQGTTKDAISRQQAIDAAKDWYEGLICGSVNGLIKRLNALPPAQPEPAIPLSWIEKYIEWLKSLDNEFANLAAAHISVMVKKWRDEQNERTD